MAASHHYVTPQNSDIEQTKTVQLEIYKTF